MRGAGTLAGHYAPLWATTCQRAAHTHATEHPKLKIAEDLLLTELADVAV